MRVKLSNYREGCSIANVKTEVDGVELPNVTDIRLHCPVDGVAKLTVGMLASQIDVELDARVQVTFTAVPDFRLEVETVGDKQIIRMVAE